MARISEVPVAPCSSGYNARSLRFTEAWRPESRDPNPDLGGKQPSGIVGRVTQRVLSRRDVLRDWLRYKAKERTQNEASPHPALLSGNPRPMVATS